MLFVGLIALIAPWFGRSALAWIVDMTSLGTSVVFLYVCLAAMKFAKLEGNGAMRKWGIAGAVCSLIFIALMVIPGSAAALYKQAWIMLAIWIVLGIIFWGVKHKDYLSE